MENKVVGGPTLGGEPAAAESERIVCVIARDVLPLDRQDSDSSPFTTTVWRGRWLILGFIVGFGLLSVASALLATEWYQAEVVLTPTGTKDTPGLANVLGSLAGGLGVGLAGVTLGSPNTAEPIGVLKSREFARQFIEEQGLLHVLLADKWDAKAEHWKQTNPKKQPDMRDAVRYFDTHVLTVREDKRTGLVTVDIEWKSADAAASWANIIVDRLNEQMRARALAEAQANVDYLRNELAQTNVVAEQQAISKLLETEMQKVMVARGSKQFAFRVVDPAAVPKWRSSPRRTVVVALGVLAGGLAGLIAVFARDSYKGRPWTNVARPSAAAPT
jgi:uncharacterized protein involved in exopolysaccharide biosynthesis